MHRSFSWLGSLVVVAGLAAACGSSEPEPGSDPTTVGSTGDAGQGGSTGAMPPTTSGETTGQGTGGNPTAGAGGSTGATPTTSTATGPGPESCDPYALRTIPPELLIGPLGLEDALLDQIASATTSIDLMMYQLSRTSMVNALVDAKERGVTVRVSLDGDQVSNGNAKTKFAAAGIDTRNAPADFEHAHAKVMIVDGDRAVVMSANMNSYSFETERNYGVVLRDADDLADLQAIFDADFDGAPLDLTCTRLVVSPENARDRLLDLIHGAGDALDLEIMYASDDDTVEAILGRAAAGAKVRVIFASPYWIDGNADTADVLQAGGVEVRFLYDYEVHAKLVLTPDAAFVGSENFSWTSLNANREVGVFLTEEAIVGAAKDRFDADWLLAEAP